MKQSRHNTIKYLIVCLTVLLSTPGLLFAEVYMHTMAKWDHVKKWYDDPTPTYEIWGPKDIIPAAEYDKLIYDMNTMEEKWTQVVGFKAPEVVGKIAPEIKPGKYGYRDKEKYPGLKELMIPVQYDKFRAPGPPIGLTCSEFELVPTRQYHYNLPIAESSLANEGKTRQDSDGYMIYDSYDRGIPFPKPSGPFKAQQIMYNWEQRYLGNEQYFAITRIHTYNRDLKLTWNSVAEASELKLNGRCTLPPYGFYDDRAKTRNITRLTNFKYLSPRDNYGNVIYFMNKGGIEDTNKLAIWLAQIRRLRKLSGTDSQDTAAGANVIFDDYGGFNQKLHPRIYPYEYRLAEEREFIVPAYTLDGSNTVAKNLDQKNVKMERRPVYVIELKQKDTRYVYGRRLLYFDKETFLLLAIVNFDQQGRLWRSVEPSYAFFPEIGFFGWHNFYTWDYIDPQTEYASHYFLPATWMKWDHLSLNALKRKGK